MSKHYHSFEEIDKDLKILRLQREIEVESLKLAFNESKRSLYPSNLIGGTSGLIKKLLISFFAKKLVDRFTR